MGPFENERADGGETVGRASVCGLLLDVQTVAWDPSGRVE